MHSVVPDIAAALKINSLELWKKNRFLASGSFKRNVLFKESPPSIMVNRDSIAQDWLRKREDIITP